MGKTLLAALVTMAFPLPALAQSIAQGYPGDAGIQGHPDVILAEMFDEASVANVAARWTNVKDAGNLSLDPDVPAGSPGTRSLKITDVAGRNGGYLYQMLSPGQNDRVYFRYYVKYLAGLFHHSGGWLGGYNPPTPWPQGGAGIVPTGADRFTIGFEPVTTGLRADFYTYWKDMQGIWGNYFLNDPAVVFPRDTWTCVEIMVKLNNPVSAYNGELAVWINGTLKGGPYGNLQWRTDSALNLNFIKLENYATDVPKGELKFDHVVVARSYIGPIAGGGATTAPAITQQPQNQTVTAGQTANFTVTASGTAPLSTQWQKQDPGGAFADIAGATAAAYTTSSTTAAMNGTQFRARVSNSAGSVTSSVATLTVTTTAVPPTISQQPQNRTVTQGQTATFTVTAGGTAPLAVQWQKMDPAGTSFADIAGATGAGYSTPITTLAMSGTQFRVRVSNSAGNVTSSSATLTVNASSDSDSDGLPDAWELQHFGTLSQTAGGDPDSDGFTNLAEFQAGTDPMDPLSYPGAVQTSGPPGGSSDHKACGMGTVSGAGEPSSRTLFLAAISLMLTLFRRR